MNTQSLDLQKMGLTPLTRFEIRDVEGGTSPAQQKVLAVAGGIAAAAAIVGLCVSGPVGLAIGIMAAPTATASAIVDVIDAFK